MALYKAIVLELLQEQYPTLHARLRASRMLLTAVTDYATALRTRHLAWMDELHQANPGSETTRFSGEALEMALWDLQAALPSESPPPGAAARIPRAAAMAFLRPATPSA